MAFDAHTTSARVLTSDTVDPKALALALITIVQTMKPKAKWKAIEAIQGRAAALAPDPVDLAVVRLHGHRGSPESRIENRRLSDGLWTVARMLG